jgi:UDP-glucose:(heptosyl)LPS alpha-1,3-glucosyltransferase
MVIAEAMAAAVPVVISDRCGIAPEVLSEAGSVLAIDAGASAWAEACDRQLGGNRPARSFERGWGRVAQEQLKAYRRIACSLAGGLAGL